MSPSLESQQAPHHVPGMHERRFWRPSRASEVAVWLKLELRKFRAGEVASLKGMARVRHFVDRPMVGQ